MILKIYKKLRKYRKIIYLDIKNKVQFGAKAPRHAERIWINPKNCFKAILMDAEKARNNSAQVLEKFPPEGAKIVSIFQIEKIEASFQHWVEGKPWEDTVYIKRFPRSKWNENAGAFRKYRNGCFDDLFEDVKKEGRLKTRKELSFLNFREDGGVLIHIGPEGELYQGNAGNRRFSIALILGLELIPATLGYVHKDGIKYLPELRKKDKLD